VLAAVLAQRGFRRVIATDWDPRASRALARTSSVSGCRSKWKSCTQIFFPKAGRARSVQSALGARAAELSH